MTHRRAASRFTLVVIVAFCARVVHAQRASICSDPDALEFAVLHQLSGVLGVLPSEVQYEHKSAADLKAMKQKIHCLKDWARQQKPDCLRDYYLRWLRNYDESIAIYEHPDPVLAAQDAASKSAQKRSRMLKLPVPPCPIMKQ